MNAGGTAELFLPSGQARDRLLKALGPGATARECLSTSPASQRHDGKRRYDLRDQKGISSLVDSRAFKSRSNRAQQSCSNCSNSLARMTDHAPCGRGSTAHRDVALLIPRPQLG